MSDWWESDPLVEEKSAPPSEEFWANDPVVDQAPAAELETAPEIAPTAAPRTASSMTQAAGNAVIRGGLGLRKNANTMLAESLQQMSEDSGRSMDEIVEDSDDTTPGFKPYNPRAAGSGIKTGSKDYVPEVEGLWRWATSRLANMAGYGEEELRNSAEGRIASAAADHIASSKIPRSAAAQRFVDAKQSGKISGFQDIINYAWNDPASVAAMGVETTIESSPSLVAGLTAGLVTRNPGSAAVVMGGTSYFQERYGTVLDFLADNGVDLSDPVAAKAAISNKELMAKADELGIRRGAIVAAFDTISGILGAGELAKGPIKNFVSGMVTQGALGGGGEAAAQKATTGKIDWSDVALEALAEFTTAPIEMVGVGRQYLADKGKTTSEINVEEVLGDVVAGKPGAREALVAHGMTAEQIDDMLKRRGSTGGPQIEQTGEAGANAAEAAAIGATQDQQTPKVASVVERAKQIAEQRAAAAAAAAAPPAAPTSESNSAAPASPPAAEQSQPVASPSPTATEPPAAGVAADPAAPTETPTTPPITEAAPPKNEAFDKAVETVRAYNNASLGFLIGRLGIGEKRARKLQFELEDAGIISRPNERGIRTVIRDTSASNPDTNTVPEAPDTIAAQQKALVEGKRHVVFFPDGTKPARPPKGSVRIKVEGAGVFDFMPGTISPNDIRTIVKAGRLNELLELGPVNKQEAAASAAQGNAPVGVVERTPDGTEVKAAAGTTETAPSQVTALEATKAASDNVVTVEDPQKVIDDRRAASGVRKIDPSTLSDEERARYGMAPRAAGKILEDISPEGQAKKEAARKAEAERVAAIMKQDADKEKADLRIVESEAKREEVQGKVEEGGYASVEDEADARLNIGNTSWENNERAAARAAARVTKDTFDTAVPNMPEVVQDNNIAQMAAFLRQAAALGTARFADATKAAKADDAKLSKKGAAFLKIRAKAGYETVTGHGVWLAEAKRMLRRAENIPGSDSKRKELLSDLNAFISATEALKSGDDSQIRNLRQEGNAGLERTESSDTDRKEFDSEIATAGMGAGESSKVREEEDAAGRTYSSEVNDADANDALAKADLATGESSRVRRDEPVEEGVDYTIAAKTSDKVKVEKVKKRTIKRLMRDGSGVTAKEETVLPLDESKVIETHKLKDALNRLNLLKGNYLNQLIVNKIIGRLREKVGEVPIKIVDQETLDAMYPDRKPGNVDGYYDPQKRHIVLSANFLKNGKFDRQILAHEGVHAYLQVAIDTNATLKKDIQEILDHVKGVTPGSNIYGLKDVHEFISEALSNPDFQNHLMKIKVPDAMAAKFDMPKDEGRASMWHALINAVGKALGLGTGKKQLDALSYALRLADRAAESVDASNEGSLLDGMRERGLLSEGRRPKLVHKRYEEQARELEKQLAKLQKQIDGLRQRADDFTAASEKLIVPGAAKNRRARAGSMRQQAAAYERTKAKMQEQIDRLRKRAEVYRKDYEENGNRVYLSEGRQAPRNAIGAMIQAFDRDYKAELTAAGVPEDTAAELDAFIKEELGKSIDPATVSLLVGDYVKEFAPSAAPSTSGSNTPPAPPAGASPAAAPAGPKLGKATDMRGYALKFNTLDYIRQTYDKYFNGLIAPYVKVIQRYDKIASDVAEVHDKDGAELLELMRTDPTEGKALADLAMEASQLNVQLGPNGKNSHLGKNSTRGHQGRQRLAGLNVRYDALKPETRKLYDRMVKNYRETHNNNIRALAYNLLVDLDLKNRLSNSDLMMLLDKTVAGTLKKEDADLIGEPKIYKELKRATSLRTIEGDYFPQMRFGNYVVLSKDKIADPGITQVTSGSRRFPVKTSVKDNVVTFRMDSALAGGKAALNKAVLKYIDASDLTLLRATKTFVDKNGKVTRPGDMDFTKDYDILWKLEFQTRGVNFFETRKEADKFREDLIKQSGATLDGPPSEVLDRRVDSDKFEKLISGSALTEVTKRIDNNKDVKDWQKKQMRAAVQEAIISQMSGNRAQKRHQARRNVKGASKDIARAAITYGQAAGNYYAMLETSKEVRETLGAIEKYNSDNENAEGAGVRSQVINELRQRQGTLNEPLYLNKWLQHIATLSFLDKLFGPSHSIINFMQVIGNTAPYLGGKYGNVKASSAIMNAYSKIGTGEVVVGGVKNTANAVSNWKKSWLDTEDLIGSVRKKLGAKYDPLIDELVERGILEPNSGFEIGSAVTAGNDKVSTGLAKIDRAARQLPGSIEVVNRVVAAVAAFDLATSAGKNRPDAINEAYDTVSMTQGDYRSSNNPRFMRIKGLSFALQFKKYAVMQTQLIGDIYVRALKGATVQEREIAQKQLVNLFAVQTMIAGTLGLPGLEIIKLALMLVSYIFPSLGWDELEEKYKKILDNSIGATASELIRKGVLTRALQIDVSERMSQADLWTGFVPNTLDKAGVQQYFGQLLLGAPGSNVMEWGDGIKALKEGDVTTFVQKIVPMKFAADTITAVKGYRDGKYNAGEAIGKSLGFRPRREALKAERDDIKFNASKRVTAERNKLFKDYINARSEADLVRLKARIREFNARMGKDGRKLSIPSLEKKRREEIKAYSE